MQARYRPRLTPLVIAGIAAFGVVACGGEDPSGGTSVTLGNRDASLPDLTAPPAATRDAGPNPQAIVDGDHVLCTHDEGDLFGFDLPALDGSTALVGDTDGFAMLYGGDPGELLLRAVALDAPAEDAVMVAGGAIEAAAPLIGASSQRFLVVYRSAADDRLFARMLTAGEDLQLLADQVATDAEGGVLVSVVGVTDGFVVGWVERDGALQLARLGLDGEVQASRRHDPLSPSVRHLRLGEFSNGRLLVAWSTDGDGGQVSIMGQLFDADLSTGEPQVLLSGVAPASASRFDLAVHGDSAGLVYPAIEGGVREALKFRRVEPDGSVTGPLLNIVNGPRRSIDGAIAAFGQGYVVSYRLLPSPGEVDERIEVAFVNQFGAIIYRGSLGPSSAEGGPTSVATTAGGHVLAAWNAAADGGEAEVRAAKLYCPGALVLCGGDLP